MAHFSNLHSLLINCSILQYVTLCRIVFDYTTLHLLNTCYIILNCVTFYRMYYFIALL